MNVASDHPLATFYVLALAIAGAVMVVSLRLGRRPSVHGWMPRLFASLAERDEYPNAVTIARFATREPIAAGILVFAAAPSIAAVVTAAAGDGGAGLRRLGRALLLWHHVPASRALLTYAAAVAVYLAVCGLLVVAIDRHGDPVERTRRRRRFPRPAPLRLLGAAFIDEGGTLEELGWRGFALPLVVASTASRATAALLIGVLWWAWHLPREVPALARPEHRWATVRGQVPFLVMVLAQSGLITWLWTRTGGSVWIAILVHGGTNVWSKGLSGPIDHWLVRRTEPVALNVRDVIVLLLGALAYVFVLR